MRFLAFFCILGIISSLCPIQTLARPVYGKQSLVSEIEAAVREVSPEAKVGVAIKSMKYGDMVYTKNDRSLFVPASTLKIFTAEAALLYLGPNYKFSTRFVTSPNATVRDGKLYGDVYLVNSGDPSLTYLDLADLMAELKTQRINQIVGNVYIDNTAYDTTTTGPGWLWNDKKFCYGAPISASIINHNCLSYQSKLTTAGNTPPKAVTDPHVYFSKIKNSVMTIPRDSTTCYVKLNGVKSGIIAISGCLPKDHIASGFSSVITDVVRYDRSILQDLFRRYGIQVNGMINSGNAAGHTQVLAKHDSKPLRVLINNMLKMSDNIIAGSLFKKMGELYTRRPGTWESGGNAVSRILSQQAKVDNWNLNLIDGSGLSRYNQVTPAQMLQLLDFTFHHDGTNYEFISSLPIAGVDGTLKRRLKNVAWKVRAKTGTMSGVVSLAGYAMSADKEPYAFVIIVNGEHGSIWKYREMEDKIVNLLTNYSRS